MLSDDEGDRIGASLGKLAGHHLSKSCQLKPITTGPKGKAMILQNHGLLTVGQTVNEACFLMTLLEGACRTQLLAEAAAAHGIPKVVVPNEGAKYTFENSSDPETLYWEGQPDLDYEEFKAKGMHQN